MHFPDIGVKAVDRFGVIHIAQRVSATVADAMDEKPGDVRFPELLRSLLRHEVDQPVSLEMPLKSVPRQRGSRWREKRW